MQADVEQAAAWSPIEPPLRSSTEIQGNILAGFKKPHQAFVFLNFDDPDRAQQWLRGLQPDVSTTAEVAAFNDEFQAARRRLGQDPPNLKALWRNVSFTNAGLHQLAPRLRGEFNLKSDLEPYPAFTAGPYGTRFQGDDEVQGYKHAVSAGMLQSSDRRRRGDVAERRVTTAELLGDEGRSGPEHWLVGGPNQDPVHALLTIAADDLGALLETVAAERRRAEEQGLRVLRVQHGDSLPQGTEHFGFREGVSQPGVAGFTRAVIRHRRWEDAEHKGAPVIATGEFLLGWRGERTRAASRPSPTAAQAWLHNGSFQVFRRLTQDVDEWWAKMRELGDASTPTGYLAAQAIGRWPDGAPLAPATDREGDNDFDYDQDPSGRHTPRFAHIRKVNPRNDPVFRDRTHRMLRRGIPFTEQDGERGLLFNAFMANIEYQFEFVQWGWANNAHFPSMPFDTLDRQEAIMDGPDPVVGGADASCLLRREGEPDRRLDFAAFVRTTGAVYAFAPSISALRWLAGIEGAEPRAVE